MTDTRAPAMIVTFFAPARSAEPLPDSSAEPLPDSQAPPPLPASPTPEWMLSEGLLSGAEEPEYFPCTNLEAT